MVALAPRQLALYEASFLVGALPASLGPEPALRAALEQQALAVQAAHRAGRSCVAGLLRSYGAKGSDAEILGAELTLDEARALIMLEYALIYAAAHGRREVVELLLSKSPDLDVKEPVYGGSAIGMAGYPHASAGRPNGNPEIVELLRRARR